MSSNYKHIINVGNYEEYFILYMDDELDGGQKLMVDNFIAEHPQLSEELERLMSLRLPVDEVKFLSKDELLSGNMRANLVDESVLLYIDNELPVAERKAVEQKIISDKEFAAQHSILAQTKLDASEKTFHPNKTELYRHTEKVVAFKMWMRVAAAVFFLLVGSLFFFTNRNEKLPVNNGVVVKPGTYNAPNNKEEEQKAPIEQLLKQQAPLQQEAPLVKAPAKKANNPVVKNVGSDDKEDIKINNVSDDNDDALVKNNEALQQREAIVFDASRFTDASSNESFKKPLTASAVTFNFSQSSNNPNTPSNNPDEFDGDFKDKKKTPAKGFFRKISRFIERNTGIGTVNADNELLIGAVALKLK